MKMNWKRSLVILLTLFSYILLLSGCEKNTEATIRYARNGVVRVVSFNEDGGGAFGTAFGVGTQGKDTDTFVTNRHVVTDNYGNICKEIYLMLDTGAFAQQATLDADGQVTQETLLDENLLVPCEVLYTTADYPDVAIIRATTPVFGIKALPLMEGEKAQVLQTVYALGYPGVIDNDGKSLAEGAITQQYLAGLEDMAVTEGKIARFTTLEQYGGTKGIYHGAHINHGNSGGPLLTEDGAVIGINTYGVPNDEGLVISIYIDYAMEALDQLEIPYDIYTESINVWLLIVVIAAAVVAAAAAYILVVRRRGGDKIPVPAGGAADRSPEMAKPASRASAAPQSSSPVTLSLRGTGGEMQGRTWVLGTAPVVIGREAGCTVQFKADTRGVSRRHCSVALVNGAVVLTDANSSCGTFASGSRIAAGSGVTLRPGDSFYVGDPENSFVVEQPGAQPRPQPKPTLSLCGTGGEMQGRIWPLGTAPVVIGREAGCTVQFKADARGVSRRHCSVALVNGAVVLTDTNSSCGTFVSGSRIAASSGATLRPGDSFYVGDPKNSFVIQ